MNGEIEGVDEEKPKKESLTFLYILIGLGLSPLAFEIFILIFETIGNAIGFANQYCYTDNFWLTSLYGILISAGLTCTIPTTIMVGYGVNRTLTGKKYASAIIFGGIVLTLLDASMAFAGYSWYQPHSTQDVYKQAKKALTELDQRADKLQNGGSYQVEQLKAGSISFSKVGTVEVISNNDNCLVAVAKHECLKRDIMWNSCQNGMQLKTRKLQ